MHARHRLQLIPADRGSQPELPPEHRRARQPIPLRRRDDRESMDQRRRHVLTEGVVPTSLFILIITIFPPAARADATPSPAVHAARQQDARRGDVAGIAGELHAVFGGAERGGADAFAGRQHRPGEYAPLGALANGAGAALLLGHEL